MCELVCEDGSDGEFVVHVVRKVHEDGVCDDVRVLGRVDSREVLVFDEDGNVCRGQGSEGERALEVLTSRGVVEVDGVDLEDVVAVDCRGVDVFTELSGIELSVVKVADGEGNLYGR